MLFPQFLCQFDYGKHRSRLELRFLSFPAPGTASEFLHYKLSKIFSLWNG